MPRTLPRRAFTLMELLIVVAIIALLIGIFAVSLRGVRAAASRTKSLGALRQMATGYNMYSQDNNGRLLPGYIDITLMVDGQDQPFEDLRVTLPSGESLTDVDMQSYVWRLAPYVDDSWQTFFEETDAAAMAGFTAEYQRMAPNSSRPHTPGLISEQPSFGLNSIFVGGDSEHGGSVSSEHPWQDTLPVKAATRLSQVVNPTRVIVFAPAAMAAAAASDDVYEDISVGFCEIRAPYLALVGDTWEIQQWSIAGNGLVEQATTGNFIAPPGGGLPIARTAKDVRNGGREPIPVAHLDGSTAVQAITDLMADMRRWDPFEVSLHKVQ